MPMQISFLDYRGVSLYRAKKGDEECFLLYALAPCTQVEKSKNIFDIRRLPKKYNKSRSKLGLDPAATIPGADYFIKGLVHKQLFRHAIDDGYDFEAAARGNYLQLRRRLGKWIKSKIRTQS